MPHTYLTQEEKARILAWRQEKVKIKEIVRRSGRAKSTVMALLAAASGLPPDVCPQYKPIPGRPRKTTKGTDNLLRREVLKNPRLTASQLKESHPKLLAKVSARTVRHRLQKDLKLPSRTAARKPLLNDRMRKARLAFAKKYSKWTKEQWAKVMWSDESTFQLFPSQHVKVRRPSSASRYDPAYTSPTVKHSASVMVWGCFSGAVGRGGLYFLPKNVMMNGERYMTVLNDHLLQSYAIHDCNIFMHDSAPCHKAKKVAKWLSEKSIQVLEWPGNSPDLNPIENCWHVIKKKLVENKQSSLPNFIEAIKKVWCTDMSTDYFRKLSDSMPKRLQDVIKKKGNMTKY